MAIAGKVGAVFLQTDDPPVVFTDEPCSGDLTFTRYQIDDPAHRYWDRNTAVTVQVNDVPFSSGFELEHLGGVVVFTTPLELDDEVTVSGQSITVSQRGGFFNWSCELATDNADTTTFESNGWKENLPTIKGFSASAESYWGDFELFKSLGEQLIIALYVDNTSYHTRYEGYAYISSDSVETAVDDVVSESVEFEGNGRLYFRGD